MEIKKIARLIALIIGMMITAGLYFAPLCMVLNVDQIDLLKDNMQTWMVLFTMIIMFYFKEEEK